MASLQAKIDYARSVARNAALTDILRDVAIVVNRPHEADEVLDVIRKAMKGNDQMIDHYAKALAEEAMRDK